MIGKASIRLGAGAARTVGAVALGGLLLGAAGANPARAQAPAPMNETGCCCVAIKGGKIGCGEKSQADCLAEQPKTPLYDQLPAWAHAVAESKADENVKMKTGWRAGKCPS
jgi:hypothetical protein